MMFLSLATTQVQAQTFSGQAVGTQSETRVQVGTAPATATAVLAARLADTGPLPPQGGSRQAAVLTATANVALGTGALTGTLNTGILATSTSGGNDMSQSQARVANLNLSVGGILGNNTITGDAITTDTNCTCSLSDVATCSGTTNVKNLNITLSDGTVIATLNGNVAPNTMFSARVVTTDALGVTTTTTTTIIVNEQIRTVDSDPTTDNITVNGLRVIVTSSVTGAFGITTTTTSDTIIAQAHSDINCAAAPLTDLQITKFCVNNANRITCTITVTNISGNAATDVVITDILPTNTTFVSATGSAGVTVTSNTPPGGQTVVTGMIATLASGASATITVVSNVAPGTPAGTRITNIATVATATTDAVSANNRAAATVTVVTVLAPTAASATISGRVLTSKGRGLPGATVVLTDLNGEVKYAVANSRGFYRFSDIKVGENYLLSVRSKRYGFTTQNIFVTEDLTDIDIMPSL